MIKIDIKIKYYKYLGMEGALVYFTLKLGERCNLFSSDKKIESTN
jgi:hypothetical protein